METNEELSRKSRNVHYDVYQRNLQTVLKGAIINQVSNIIAVRVVLAILDDLTANDIDESFLVKSCLDSKSKHGLRSVRLETADNGRVPLW